MHMDYESPGTIDSETPTPLWYPASAFTLPRRRTAGKIAASIEGMTLQEVAKRAKVSTATVSRVLNDTGRVKEAARARVLKAVDELNYHPNIHARTLAHGRCRTLGLIVSNLKNPFFLDIFQALERDAHEKGFEVVVANTDYRPEQLVTHARLMQGRRVAGLAVVVSEMDPDAGRGARGQPDPRRLLRRGGGGPPLREDPDGLRPGDAPGGRVPPVARPPAAGLRRSPRRARAPARPRERLRRGGAGLLRGLGPHGGGGRGGQPRGRAPRRPAAVRVRLPAHRDRLRQRLHGPRA